MKSFAVKQLEFLYRGTDVQRFHCWPLLRQQTVGQHAFNVAVLCLILYPKLPAMELFILLQAALYHDLPEQVTGDVQAPAKRSSKVLKNILDDLEEQALVDVEMNMTLGPDNYRRLKMADNFDGLAKCVQERKMGSRCIDEAALNYMSYIEEHIVPCSREEEVFNYLKEEWLKYDR